MNKQKKLTIQMAIFTFIIFVCFGIIIVTEKMAPSFAPRIDKKLNEYIKSNYTSIINDLNIGKTNYKNTVYQLKITSEENENLYFYLKYERKAIADTYEEDYKQGKTLLTKISSDIESDLKQKYKRDFKVIILKSLDKFSDQIKSRIIKEEDIASLPIYSLESKTSATWTVQNIKEEIQGFHNRLLQDNITPKSYNLIISDKDKKSKSIKINNLTKNVIEDNELLSTIINDIITGKNSNLLNENNITYEQLKEEK